MVTGTEADITTGEQDQAGQGATPEQTPPAATPEPDYKAELASTKQELATEREERARLKTRLDGMQGTIHQRQDWEMALKRNDQKIGDLQDLVKSLVLAQSDDPEHPARKTLTNMEARSEEQRQKSLTEERMYEDWGDTLALVAQAEGKPLVTEADGQALSALLQSDPAWREVNALTQDGFGKGNPKLVRQALHKAREIAEARREQHYNSKLQAEIARVKGEAEEDKKKALSPFMKSINPAPAGTGAKGRKPTQEELAAASAAEYLAKKTSGEWVF